MANRQNKGAWSGIFGGLSGGVFFFGLAIAVVSGHFLPVFFATLALTALVGSSCFAQCAGHIWRLPGVCLPDGACHPGLDRLVVARHSHLAWHRFDSRHAQHPWHGRFFGLGILSRNSRQPKEEYQEADHRYEEGYQPQQPPLTYQEGASEYQYPSSSGEQPYEQQQTHTPQQMPPQ